MTWLAAAVILSACAYVPDAANPVEWYKGIAGWFEDDEGAEPEIVEIERPGPTGKDQSFPTLSEVPERPVPVTTVEERRRIMEGLSADREHARYADEDEAAPPRKAPAPGAAEPTPLPPAGTPRTAAPPPAAAPAPAAPAPATPAPAPTAAPKAPPQVAAAPPAAAKKTYLSPLDKATPAPAPKAPPPAVKAAPRAPVQQAPVPGAQATLSPAPGARAVGDVYSRKLQESAPTVTTTPAGPLGARAPAITPPGQPAAPARQAAEITGPRSLEDFDVTRSGLSVQVGTVLFKHGSSKLNSAARKVLREIARQQKASGGTIRVIGHASSRTRDLPPVRHQLANFTESIRRADVVARELMRLGVSPDRIFVGARSDSEPIYYESMPTGEAGNRRAEIFIDY